jgi:excinuclease ABC subunit B
MYADTITRSIQRAIKETNRRRTIQLAYNAKHGITPKTIIKEIKDILPNIDEILKLEMKPIPKSKTALEKLIADKTREMKEAAKQLDFELATILRDEIGVLTRKAKKG